MAHVLIIDDEPDTRELLAMLLAQEGHTTSAANNGWEALMATSEHDFDLILLDILMPGLCGGKFLKIFRRAMKAGDIPVVVVTALDREMAERRLDGMPVEGMVFKRGQMLQELKARLRTLLGTTDRGAGGAN